MKKLGVVLLSFTLLALAGLSFCTNGGSGSATPFPSPDNTVAAVPAKDTVTEQQPELVTGEFNGTAGILTGKTTREELVAFAKTLKGTPYQYGSSDPARGFDCSGFITYVFNHFNIAVPRSSVDFTQVGATIPVMTSRAGDLILFTGTDSLVKVVGHMGIITQNSPDSLLFIHSTSGSAYSVTETPLNRYYQGRFMKVIRVFK